MAETVPEAGREDPIVEQAFTALRDGIGRSRKIAAQAKLRLSELTSDTPYPGPASLILADNAAGQMAPDEAPMEDELADAPLAKVT